MFNKISYHLSWGNQSFALAICMILILTTPSFAARPIYPGCGLLLESDKLILADGRTVNLGEFEPTLRPLPLYIGSTKNRDRPGYATDEGILAEGETLEDAIRTGMATLIRVGGHLSALRDRIDAIQKSFEGEESETVVYTINGGMTDINFEDNVHLRITLDVYMTNFDSPFHAEISDSAAFRVENLSTGEQTVITPLLAHFLEFGLFRGTDHKSNRYPRTNIVDPEVLWRVLFSAGSVRHGILDLNDLAKKLEADQDAASNDAIAGFLNNSR